MAIIHKTVDADSVQKYVEDRYYQKKSWEPSVVAHQYPYGDLRRYGVTTEESTFNLTTMESVVNACKGKCPINIPDGLYTVNKNTILTLADSKQVTVTGSGSVRWNEWKNFNKPKNDIYWSKGEIPVSKLNDPIFCSMHLPSEANHYMNRTNGDIHYTPWDDTDGNAVSIGAIYKRADVDDLVLPDEFTICLGRMKLWLYQTDSGYIQLEDNSIYPDDINVLYKEGWSGETKKLDSNLVTYYDDHIEVKLTKEIFEGYILHFWGRKHIYGVTKETTKYAICAFDCWVKEPEAENIFVSAIGVDYRNTNNEIHQGYSGRSKLLTTSPHTLWGHSIPDSEYDKIVNTNLIQTQFNVKDVKLINDGDFTYKDDNISRIKPGITQLKNGILVYKAQTETDGDRVYRLNPSYDLVIPNITTYGSMDRIKIGEFSDKTNSSTQLRCSFKIRIGSGTQKTGYIAEFYLYLGCERTQNEDGSYTYSNPYATIECIKNNFPNKVFAVTFSATKGIRIYLFGAKLGYYTWHINITPITHYLHTYTNLFLSDFCIPSMSNHTGTADERSKYWITTAYEDGETEIATLNYNVSPTVGKTTLRNKLSEVFKL